MVALDALHDGNPAALSAAVSGRVLYDRATLNRLQGLLMATGARVRGQIEPAPPSWIESTELVDYEFAYHWFHDVIDPLLVLESKVAYAASDVRDHGAPRGRPGSIEPRFAMVVINLFVETAPICAAMASAGEGAKPARRTRQAEKLEAVKVAIRNRYPEGVSEAHTTADVHREVNKTIKTSRRTVVRARTELKTSK